MKRPFADKRPIGPFSQITRKTDDPVIGILFIVSKDNEIFDARKIEGVSNKLIDSMENHLQQPIEHIQPWTEDQVSKLTGVKREGLFVTAIQRDAAFGKLAPSNNTNIEKMRKRLIARKGIGKLKEEYFIASNPSSWPV